MKYLSDTGGLEKASRGAYIPASKRICDEIGASGHIPVKHLANSKASLHVLKELFVEQKEVS